MKKSLIIFVLLIFFATFVLSEEQAKPVLKSGDVEHFVKTFPSLSKEFKNLGSKYDAHKGEITFPQAMMASQEVQGILKKYDWDDSFFLKAQTIVVGYSIIRYGEELSTLDAQISQSLKEIESNPNISPELKKQMKQQLMASQQAMKTGGTSFKRSVNPKDIELIRPFIKELAIALSDKHKEDK